jgi:hypothetical protein
MGLAALGEIPSRDVRVEDVEQVTPGRTKS